MNQLFEYLLYGNKEKNEEAFSYLDASESLHSFSFSEFYREVCRARTWLREIGIKQGDRVVFLANNSVSFLALLMAVWGNGEVAVFMNPYNSLSEVQYEIDLVQPKVILHDGFFADAEPTFLIRNGSLCRDILDYRASEPEDIKPADVSDKELCTILFTSGTTGHSKGVMLSYENLQNGIWATHCLSIQKAHVSGKDMNYASFPFFHVSGLTATLGWFVSGFPSAICLDKRFFFRDINRLPITDIGVVPDELSTIYRNFQHGKTDCIGRVYRITVGAASASPEVIQFFQERGISFCTVYGLSENTGLAIAGVLTPKTAGSVGKAEFRTEARLEDGEICLRGKSVMMGYYRNPEATAEVLQDGWLHTGDLGRVDSDGFYFIVGRKKRLIILGNGENVSPEELESLLLQNEEILECFVKEEDGKICAEIFSKAEEKDVHTIVNQVNRGLPFFKRIHIIHLRREAFKKTTTGKIKM